MTEETRNLYSMFSGWTTTTLWLATEATVHIGLIAVIVPQPAAIPIERLLTVRHLGVMRHRYIIRLLTRALRRRPNIIHLHRLGPVQEGVQSCL
jgi:hypothetical protein